MPRNAYPQQGLAPADGVQCGPYTAAEWQAWMLSSQRAGGMVNTGAVAPPGLPSTPLFPNVGVYLSVPGYLAVASPGASQISINTGAWLCDGIFGYNDTAISGTAITNPVANPRIDRVVVRQNYTVADYTSPNAAALTVEANTCDIVIISGAEAVGPVAPTLTQDQDRLTYWDIPLAQYEISIAGVITGLTDEREWVDAETKQISVFAGSAWNDTDGTPITSYYDEGLVFPDSKICSSGAMWRMPINYISGLSIKSIWVPAATGDVYITSRANWAECGQAFNTHVDSVGLAAVSVTNSLISCLQELTPTPVATDDIFWLYARRDATDPLDTVNNEVWFWGWIIEYLGWGRR